MAEVKLEPLPFREAIAALKARGVELRPTFHYLDMFQQEHASAFTVAKAMQLDLLRDIHEAVTRAEEAGETLETFTRRLKPELVRRGWWGRQEMVDPITGDLTEVQLGSPHRLRTIFQTNIRTAHATGRWERFERTRATRPYLRYVAVLDDRTRQQHRAWHGTILPIGATWWETHAPPNGWGCRCQLVSLTERDLQRYGWRVSEEPEVKTRRWRNRRTGDVSDVPVGIDPGWAYNVGAAGARARGRVAGTAEAVADKLTQAEPALAAETWRATPQLRQALAGDWNGIARRAMSTDARTRGEARAERRLLGVIPQSAMTRLLALDPSIANGVLTAAGGEISHATRPVKAKDRKTAVDEAVLADLVDHLAEPQAIVGEMGIDALTQLERIVALHYVTGPGAPGRAGPRVAKVVFRRPAPRAGRWADGMERARMVWSVATAGLVQTRNLEGARHVLLWGSL